MRYIACAVGVLWMAACFIAWLWIGFMDWSPLDSFPRLTNWSIASLLDDNKMGLTFLPILLGGVGAAIFAWGAKGMEERKKQP